MSDLPADPDPADTGDERASEPSAKGEPLPPPLPPGPEPAAVGRSLFRSPDDRKWLGVAAALAQYLGVPVSAVRLIFFFATFAGCLGLIAYLLGALLIPEAGSRGGLGDRVTGGRPEVLLVLIGALALVFFGIFNTGTSDLTAIGILVAVGVFFWARSTSPMGPALPNAQRSGGPEGGGSWPSPTGAPGMSSIGRPSFNGANPPPFPPAPSRFRRGSGRFGAVVLVAASVAALVGALAGSVLAAFAAPAAVIVAGMVIGALARFKVGWLVVPLLIVAALIFPASWYGHAGVPLSSGAGELKLTAADFAADPDDKLDEPVATEKARRRLSAGAIEVDLTSVTTSKSFTIAVGAGEIRVVVPEGVNLNVRSSVGAGEIDLFDSNSSGVKVSVNRLYAIAEGAPTIDLDLKAGLGYILLEYSTERPPPDPAANPVTTIGVG